MFSLAGRDGCWSDLAIRNESPGSKTDVGYVERRQWSPVRDDGAPLKLLGKRRILNPGSETGDETSDGPPGRVPTLPFRLDAVVLLVRARDEFRDVSKGTLEYPGRARVSPEPP